MRQNEANADIRRRAAAAGIPLWLLAKTAGIADTTATRWMREELSENDSRRIRLIMALRQLEYEKKIQLTAELHKLNNKTKEGADLSILQSSSGD